MGLVLLGRLCHNQLLNFHTTAYQLVPFFSKEA